MKCSSSLKSQDQSTGIGHLERIVFYGFSILYSIPYIFRRNSPLKHPLNRMHTKKKLWISHLWTPALYMPLSLGTTYTILFMAVSFADPG